MERMGRFYCRVCDCVGRPLPKFIRSRKTNNPQCFMVMSVERKTSDGIDDFLERMKGTEYVGKVERVELEDGGRDLELYLITGVE